MPTITKSNIEYDKRSLSDKVLLKLYYNMLKPRLIEEKMLILLRQGKISKWFSGIGQEAISVGVNMALKPSEYIISESSSNCAPAFMALDVPYPRGPLLFWAMFFWFVFWLVFSTYPLPSNPRPHANFCKNIQV